MTSMSFTMLGLQLRRKGAWKTDDSAPRVVALDRASHAARSAAAAHELGTLEGDDGAFGVGHASVPRQKVHPLYHTEASAFHLAKRGDVARVGKYQPGPHRDEVAPRCPLLALLHDPSITTTPDGRQGHAAVAQGGKDVGLLVQRVV